MAVVSVSASSLVGEKYDSVVDAFRTLPWSVEYLVVAGGGGGCGNLGGGGGAGGFRTSAGTSGGGASAESSLTLNQSTSYTVTVGAGGVGGIVGNTARGTSGVNSVFSTIRSDS